MSATPGPCPTCGSSRTRQVGETIAPPSLALKCDGCGHMWVSEPTHHTGGPDVCPKCGSALRNVGAPSLAARYLRCESCNHLVIVPPR